MLFCFFFQAEDGIRDGHVTGVQTCALPISEGTERGVDRQEADCRAYAAARGWEVVAVFRENDTSAFKQRTITLPSGERVRRVRSEERRGGEGGRWRWERAV